MVPGLHLPSGKPLPRNMAKVVLPLPPLGFFLSPMKSACFETKQAMMLRRVQASFKVAFQRTTQTQITPTPLPQRNEAQQLPTPKPKPLLSRDVEAAERTRAPAPRLEPQPGASRGGPAGHGFANSTDLCVVTCWLFRQGCGQDIRSLDRCTAFCRMRVAGSLGEFGWFGWARHTRLGMSGHYSAPFGEWVSSRDRWDLWHSRKTCITPPLQMLL